MKATRNAYGSRFSRILAASMARASAIALATAFLSGCATDSVRVTPARSAHAPLGELALTGIELESIYTYAESLAEIESVIVSSASRSGIAIAPRNVRSTKEASRSGGTDGAKAESDEERSFAATDSNAAGGAGGRATIALIIREQGYTKGFKSTLSLAIIADIRDDAGKTVLRAEYFHDGDESFDSIGFLSSSLDATFKKISWAMRKAR